MQFYNKMKYQRWFCNKQMQFAPGRIMQIHFTPIAHSGMCQLQKSFDFTAEKPQIKSEMCFLDKSVSEQSLNFNPYWKSVVHSSSQVFLIKSELDRLWKV